MTPDRFTALANAYGGDLTRWPMHERVLALSLCQEQPLWTAQVLNEAAVLDGLLDEFEVGAPSRALGDRILSRTRPLPTRLTSGARGWGMGLVAASLAGVICGAALMNLAVPDLSKDAIVATALGDSSPYLDAVASSAKESQ